MAQWYMRFTELLLAAACIARELEEQFDLVRRAATVLFLPSGASVLPARCWYKPLSAPKLYSFVVVRSKSTIIMTGRGKGGKGLGKGGAKRTYTA